MRRSGEDLSAARVALGALSLLPAPANNVANCNSLPFTQDALATDGERQYAVWVSGPRRAPLIAKRELPRGPWSPPVDLQAVPATPFALPTERDPHNSYAIGVDALGRLHVAGNLHNRPLSYLRSAPKSLREWAVEPMIGAQEESVTYPTFVRLPDGSLLFFYRDGRSGFGDVYLNRLPPRGERWGRLGMLVEGRSTGESPYLNHVAVSATGVLHVSGCFRERSASAAWNRDVWHALSEDGGATWRSAAGERLDLPLRHGSAPIAVSTVPSGSGLVNQTGMDVDLDGNPHIAYFRYDERGATQIAHAWHEAGAWRTRDVTALTHRMETDTPIVDASVARPAVACMDDGEVWTIFRASHDGYGGRAVCVRCTPGEEPREVTLYGGDLGGWEPSYDTAALRRRNELHLLLTAAPPYAREAKEVPESGWTEQPIGVLAVSADKLSRAAGRSGGGGRRA
jgi:putative BNR repeat neuraminidase